ncbi:MAG: hypothetical protein IE933_00275 [Sphingomonadales bacterium]|nr:hypothetical protein [Sphingomonadales bacterium]MBD3772760.1 hypothetical protein [Paracoccaceae bacterium]
MTEERITRVDSPDGDPHTTHTTIIHDGGDRRGGISGWFVMFAVLLAVLVGVWAFTSMGGAEMAKDNAIADAADNVGAAANKVGDAAQDVADNVTNNN